MSCLFGHNYVKTRTGTATRYSLIDPYGTEVAVIVFHCSKCGNRKVVEA